MECVAKNGIRSPNSLGAQLSQLDEFWDYWRFEPWSVGPFVGVSRNQRFVKDGILGSVAEYKAWEAIIWETGDETDREHLWKTCTSIPDVMTQRFLFVLETPWRKRRVRSFALGFRGYLEFYAYWPGHPCNAKAQDLTGLVDLALSIEERAAAS